MALRDAAYKAVQVLTPLVSLFANKWVQSAVKIWVPPYLANQYQNAMGAAGQAYFGKIGYAVGTAFGWLTKGSFAQTEAVKNKVTLIANTGGILAAGIVSVIGKVAMDKLKPQEAKPGTLLEEFQKINAMEEQKLKKQLENKENAKMEQLINICQRFEGKVDMEQVFKHIEQQGGQITIPELEEYLRELAAK